MMARIIRQTTLMLMLASVPCFVTAAGSCADSAQPMAADQIAFYAYGTYYAPGSYSSWFYVSPPAYDETRVAVEDATKQHPASTALNLPAYYDFEPRWGPLFS